MAENIGNKFDDFIILKILKKSICEDDALLKMLRIKERKEKKFYYCYVAKVKSKINNKIYAMKRIDKSLIRETKKISYYNNEYKMAEYFKNNNLNHKNLNIPLTVFTEGKILYIITEFIDGNNLFDLYHYVNIKIEEKKLLKIIDQCLQGLNYMHNNGIIHGYIQKKDEDKDIINIMIDSQDRIKFINFSRAIKKPDNNNKNNINNNNNEKILNEIVNKIKYNEKNDIYALGKVFKFLNSYCTDKNASNNLYEDVIRQMLEKEPKNRPSAETIYMIFKNKYNNIIKTCLQSFLFNFRDMILKKDIILKNDYKNANKEIKEIKEIKIKIIDLVHKKGEKENEKNLNEKKNEKELNQYLINVALLIEQEFYENGFDINDFSIKNVTDFILSIFNDDLLVKDFFSYINLSLSKESKCKNCNDTEKITEFKKCYITINTNEINKEEGNIKKLLENNINKKNEKIEYCKKCKNIVAKEISFKYNKFPKYLIILIEPGIDISEITKYKLNNFESFEFEKKYFFKLSSIIIDNKEGYDYYNRELEHKEFTKNENEANENKENKSVYNFNEMKGNIICLFYRLQINIELIAKQSEQSNPEKFKSTNIKIENNDNIQNNSKGSVNNYLNNNNK